MSGTNVVGPQGASCNGSGGCPRCRGLWPRSGWGKGIVILVALAAVGVVIGYELMRSDLSKLMARYEDLASAGKRDEAAKALGEVLGAGEALYREKKFGEAARAFEWVVSKDPKRAVALGYLGVIARDRKDDAKAVEWFTRAAEVDPLSPMHFYNLALIHYARKDYAACEKQLEQAMKLAPIKSQYRLLCAFCAEESAQPADVVKKRYRETISAAEAQVNSLPPAQIAADASLPMVWKTAAQRLEKLGDPSGRDRIRKLSLDSPKREVRDFAQAVLADMNRN